MDGERPRDGANRPPAEERLMKNRVVFFDTTLRDGEQAPGFSMTTDQKIAMAKQLDRLGADVIEAGFPIASEGDFESVRRIAQEMRGCTVAALARTKKEDIDRAWEALKGARRPRIHTFLATSDIHLKHKLKKTREEALETAVRWVRYARSLTEEVEFSAEDATRSDAGFLAQIVEAVIDAGATIVNIPDTVGYAVPDEFGRLIRTLRETVPNIGRATVSVHCHNDLGLAVANSIAALQNGARQVECTVNGIGERAGNASLEEIAMILHTRSETLKWTTGIRTREIYRSSQLLSNLTGVTVQRNKAVVGSNAFAHEAGIHQDGVLKNPLTYEIMTPVSVGIPESVLVLGKHSGRHALSKRFSEMGCRLSKEELDRVYEAFTRLADKKKEVYDADLMMLLQEKTAETPAVFVLDGLQVLSGTRLIPTATVRIRRGGEVSENSSTGDGPVDAVCRAIDRITGCPARMTEYSLNAVTKGKDAMGEVLVQIECRKRVYTGRAASTDVIEASAKAYLNAVNQAVFHHERSATEKIG
jgi:2-isopropylmalate synthase